METADGTRHDIAATVVICIALGVAVAALALWLTNVIGPPSGIVAGATAIIVLLGAARHRRKANR